MKKTKRRPPSSTRAGLRERRRGSAVRMAMAATQSSVWSGGGRATRGGGMGGRIGRGSTRAHRRCQSDSGCLGVHDGSREIDPSPCGATTATPQARALRATRTLRLRGGERAELNTRVSSPNSSMVHACGVSVAARSGQSIHQLALLHPRALHSSRVKPRLVSTPMDMPHSCFLMPML